VLLVDDSTQSPRASLHACDSDQVIRSGRTRPAYCLDPPGLHLATPVIAHLGRTRPDEPPRHCLNPMRHHGTNLMPPTPPPEGHRRSADPLPHLDRNSPPAHDRHRSSRL
jgi:hypothetical protein